MWRGWSFLCTTQSVITDAFHKAVQVTLHSPGGQIVPQRMGADILFEMRIALLYLLHVLLQNVIDTNAG